MKLRIKKAISFSLAVVLSASLIVFPAPSASASAIVSAIGSVLADSAVKGLVMNLTSQFASWGLDQVLNGSSDSDFPDTFWTPTLKASDECVFVSESSFQEIIAYLHSSGISVSPVYIDGLGYVLQCTNSTFKHPNTGETHTLYGIQGNYLTYSTGYMIVYSGSSGLEFSTERQDLWLPFSTAVSKTQVSVLTKDSLSDLCLTLNQTDRTCSVRDTEIRDQAFYVIIDSYNNIYANADGCPYVAHYDKTVTDNKYNYIIQEGDTLNEGDTIYNDNSTVIEGSTTNYEIVDNSKVIDLTNGVFNYIGQQELNEFYVDELVYDMSSQSYSADTYNVTYDNDTYNTYNYTWNITYNITNTYITNIGQTELYEPLELYYVLPDGRSSADLTAEEVAGMSFEFSDCVNYVKSATDTYLRALYHFDGNTDDSSYFSTQGKFEWLTGASITYMDVGTFDGALYLGPEEHQLKITLPSNLGFGDFTVQFRYYQEGAADTQNNIENSLAIGGTTVLQWDESYLYSKTSTTASASLGIGSWSEIAVIRSSGTIYLYYNGLNIASFTDTTAYTGTITLTLGDTTRASSMIDELRVINFALAEGGASYTCTSVPYDTNVVLVLPDSAFPIADEYWEFTSSRTNLLSKYGMDDALNLNASYLKSNSTMFTSQSGTVGEDHDFCSTGAEIWKSSSSTIYAYPYFNYNANISMLSSTTDGLTMSAFNGFSDITNGYSLTHLTYSSVSSYAYSYTGPSSTYFSSSTLWPSTGIYSLVSSRSSSKQWLAAGTYTLSLVSASGEVASCTFTVTAYSSLGRTGSTGSNSDSRPTVKNTVKTAFGYEFGLRQLCDLNGSYFYGNQYICVQPYGSTQEPIIYMELVKASSTDLTAEKISCIYSSEEVQPNTAAIQTDIPINGYTVGGVRPTFPVRGDVWMPVSNNRITNVYVYNGSAWEEVNARWYTGSRWIPIYAFDITTLEDCWDIADIDTTLVMIGTESQFWSWLQGAWQKMLDKLDAIIIALGGDPNYSPDSSGSGGTGLWNRIKQTFSDALASIIETLMTFITDVLQLVLDLVYDLLSFFFDFLTSEVITGIANLFSSFTDGSLIVFFQQEITGTDEEGNETTTTVIGLPDGIATAFAFFAGVIMILPDELRNLLIFGVGALILIGILKLAKS